MKSKTMSKCTECGEPALPESTICEDCELDLLSIDVPDGSD